MLPLESRNSWRPATVQEVQRIVKQELQSCTPEQVETFQQCAVELQQMALTRNGQPETVVIIARKGNEVMYWEDVEEGFNISPVAADETIALHYCNQDSLAQALHRWK